VHQPENGVIDLSVNEPLINESKVVISPLVADPAGP
jgi:hypothetical protein